ncbi:hypothetical protein ACHAQF_006620 [Verticillium nonalfalfae]
MFPRYDETYRAAVVPAVKGETIEGLYERVAAGVGAIIDQCDAEGIRAVVLCSHAATIIALGRVLTGEIPTTVDVEDFRAFTRFSGDESFDVVDSGSQADAGIALGVVVEGKPAGERHRQQPATPRSSVGEHHL